jgi:RimJ/RimL family protein N-acetyltransferase
MGSPMTDLVPPERFETDRFVLRSFTEHDGPALLDAMSSSYEHLAPWMAWASRDIDVATTERLARRSRGAWLMSEAFLLAIEAPEGGRLLGAGGFSLGDGGLASGVADLGLWLRADAAGQGLGHASLQAMLRWGFDAWPWQQLRWDCDTRNAASQRTAARAGMQLAEVRRDEPATVGGGTQDTASYVAQRHSWSG